VSLTLTTTQARIMGLAAYCCSGWGGGGWCLLVGVLRGGVCVEGGGGGGWGGWWGGLKGGLRVFDLPQRIRTRV